MRSATVLLFAAVLAAAGMSAFAVNGTATNATITATTNDARALNYILAFENLQWSFFDQGLQNMTAADFVTAGYNESVYTRLQTMQQQHIIHTNWLRAVIRARNETVQESCTFNFTQLFNTTSEPTTDNSTAVNVTKIEPQVFIETAMSIHNLTSKAVIGVIGRVSDQSLVETIASMAVVESQHGAYLAILQGEDPFPEPFADSLTPENLTSTALPYVEDCPFDSLVLPLNRTDVNACTNTTIIVVPTATTGPTTTPNTTTPTTTSQPTEGQSAASSVSVSSALVVTLLATIVAAAAHSVAL